MNKGLQELVNAVAEVIQCAHSGDPHVGQYQRGFTMGAMTSAYLKVTGQTYEELMRGEGVAHEKVSVKDIGHLEEGATNGAGNA